MLFSPHVPHVSWMCQGAVPELGLGRWKIPLAPRAAAGHVWSLQRLCSELGTGLHGAEHKKGHDGVLWSGSNHGTIFIGYYIYIYTYYVYNANYQTWNNIDVDSEMTILIPLESLYFPFLWARKMPGIQRLSRSTSANVSMPSVSSPLPRHRAVFSGMTEGMGEAEGEALADWLSDLFGVSTFVGMGWHQWDASIYPGLVVSSEPGKEEGHHRHE